MIGFLYRLIVGRFYVCTHDWHTIHQEQFTTVDDGFLWTVRESGIKYTLQCSHCGEITTRKVS